MNIQNQWYFSYFSFNLVCYWLNGIELFNDGALFCKCGKELLEATDVSDALFKLSLHKSNYCDICGKNLKSIDKEIEAEQEPISAEVDSRKTWDRRDR